MTTRPITTAALLFSFAALAPCSADLILHYDMEEASGSIVDEVGGLEAAPVDAGHAYGVAGPAGFGNAVSLDANGSWQLSVADSALLKDLANDFTVAAWVRVDSALAAAKTGVNPALNRIIGDDAGWDADGWAMGIWQDGRVRFTKNGIVDVDITPDPPIPFDEWAHFAATVSSTGGTSLFVNGISVGSNGNTADCNTGLGNNFVDDPYGIGRTYGIGEDQWFAGALDEVKVFDHVLNQAQVQDLMVPVRDPALVADVVFTAEGGGAMQVLEIDVENGGENNDLVISGVTFSGPDAGDFSPGALPGPVAPGATVQLPINFTPSGGKTTYEATAEIASNDPQVPVSTVNMAVTVFDPAIDVADVVDFGNLPAGAGVQMQTLTVSNTGATQDLTITALDITGAHAANYSTSALPGPISPGGSADITITLDPMGGGGLISASLEIASNAAGSPVVPVALRAAVAIGDYQSRLVSHFTFDSPAALGDDIGSFDNDGTPVGDAAHTTDAQVGGGALLLDGIDDLVQVPGGDEYSTVDDNGQGFTVTSWVCLDAAATGNMRIFSTYMPGGFTANGWAVGARGGEGTPLLATTYGVLDFDSPAPSVPTAGEWHHVAYVFRGSPVDTIEYFVDGVSVGSATGTAGLNDTTEDFAIGTIGLDGNLQAFHGKIDDLRVYDIELGGAEITEVMNSAGAPDLRIAEITYDGSQVEFSWWPTSPGRQYILERSFLDPGARPLVDWEELTDDYEAAATGDVTTYTDTLPAGTERVFYRVKEAQ